jgi:hypothetical protein
MSSLFTSLWSAGFNWKSTTRRDDIPHTTYLPNGRQGSDHPNPGKRYQGTDQTAYLSNNQEGKKILMLLKKAFEQKLTFRIRPSTTTGKDDCVVWNDIPHKTSIYISARYVFISLNDNLFVWTNLNKYALLHA